MKFELDIGTQFDIAEGIETPDKIKHRKELNLLTKEEKMETVPTPTQVTPDIVGEGKLPEVEATTPEQPAPLEVTIALKGTG